MSNAVFKDCTSLYEITIPNSISSRFYFEMFRGCNNLVTITLGKNLERIQRNTFYDCNKLRRIICKNPNVTLPKDSQYGNSFVFDNFDRSKCILEVPNGKKQAYIDAGWTGFKEIVESPSTFDVNNDGQVDVSDVNEIINVILGKKDM